MAMAVDSRQQMASMPYEHMRYQAPHFTNPWASGPPNTNQAYPTSMPGAMANDQHRQSLVATPVSMPYQQNQNALPALGMQPAPQYAYEKYPTSTGTSATSYSAPTSAAHQYPTADFSQKMPSYGSFQDRRPSHPSVAFPPSDVQQHQMAPPPTAHHNSAVVDFGDRLHTASEAERNSFSDALDASRGMVAMSQDITPRNIYGAAPVSRSSTDSYGFPSTHSSHSSISSASGYGSYYGGSSVSEASYGDYSSAGESVDVPSRTLPRPTGLMGVPPAPQSMMGQFNSKVSSSSQKKHKCKICDKRFTRPSSLTTHMYSHTGEKPFACDVEGCGRHFSVVSNLRRHKKVHKGESDHASPDDE